MKISVKAVDGTMHTDIQDRGGRKDQSGIAAEISKGGAWTSVTNGIQTFIPPHAIVAVFFDTDG